jgi:hypothetical protein
MQLPAAVVRPAGGNRRRVSGPIGERQRNGHVYAIVRKVLALAGGDVPGLMKLLERYSPVTADISVEDAAAMYLECNMSEVGYATVRKHVRGLPSQHLVGKYIQSLRVDVSPVMADGTIVGYAVSDIKSIIAERLRAYLQRNPEKAAQHRASGDDLLVEYKVGFDSFTIEPSKRSNGSRP